MIKLGLGYDFSFSNFASSSTIVIVLPANNVNSEKTKKLEAEMLQIRA